MARARYIPFQTITFTVKRNRGYRTIAGYLASRLYIHDRRAEHLLTKECVRLNGKIITMTDRVDLYAGSTIQVTFPESWPPYMQPTAMKLDIIYEDEAFIAVNKPAGIVVHPSSGHLTGNTLQNGVLHHCKDDDNPDKMISPAHRLDRYTTGVIIYSRTQKAYKLLTSQFRENTTAKKYLAITDGIAKWDELRFTAPIGINPDNKELRIVTKEQTAGSKAAETIFNVIERGRDWSLIEARPITGRSHQIRAHLKHLGLPISCDHEYNPNGRQLQSLNFQALHANELKFTHPLTGKSLTLHAELPQAMQAAIAELRNYNIL